MPAQIRVRANSKENLPHSANSVRSLPCLDEEECEKKGAHWKCKHEHRERHAVEKRPFQQKGTGKGAGQHHAAKLTPATGPRSGAKETPSMLYLDASKVVPPLARGETREWGLDACGRWRSS